MIPCYRAGFALLCVFAYAPPVVPASPERSVSSSRQFLVYGSDFRLRGAICDLAERTKRDLLTLIDRRDEWATPIVVNAQYPQANAPERPRAAFCFAQTGFGLKLQLDLTIAPEVNQPEVRREILRALLLEMMYRRDPKLSAGTAYVAPPDWLLDGIPPPHSELERGRSIEVLRAPVAARRILPLQEFLRPRKLSGLDGPSRALCRAYSFALVELLIHAPDGRGRLTHFIADFPFTSNDPMTNLGSHFPELSNANSAEKVWSLHIARLATSQPFQLFSAEETEEKLDKLLSLKFSNAGQEKNYQLDEFAKFLRTASANATLTECSRGLSILATCANPIYRPLICEYAKIATILARGKIKGTAEGLARLRASRKSVATTMRKIDDYLNWFEASKSPGPSGAFADYMSAAELAAEPEQRRRDAMSVYLDVLEAQFQN